MECEHCKKPMAVEEKLYVVGAHTYVCSTVCYLGEVARVRKLWSERGKSIPETGEKP